VVSIVCNRASSQCRLVDLSISDDRSADLRLHSHIRQVVAAPRGRLVTSRTRLHANRPTAAFFAQVHTALAAGWGFARHVVSGIDNRYSTYAQFRAANLVEQARRVGMIGFPVTVGGII
jgi:hypothetical protein